MGGDEKQYYHTGLKYIALKTAASAIRALAGFSVAKEASQAISRVPDGVTRRRIEVQSRQSGRTITVDVYEKAGNGESGPRPVHLNFHGGSRAGEELLRVSKSPIAMLQGQGSSSMR